MATVYTNGLGATVEFATSGLNLSPISITTPDREIPSEETFHLGSTEETYEPGGLFANGEVEFEVPYDPSEDLDAVFEAKLKEQITVNYPLRTGQSTPRKVQFNGHIQTLGGQEFAKEGRLVRKVTVKIDDSYQKIAAT